MLIKKITIALLSALPMISYALFCPTNFSQIQAGDTIDSVIATCGKPDAQTETTKKIDNGPQEWNYFIPQSVSVNTFQQEQGTLKTSISFDENGKAINILVNGIGVGATTICGSTVQLGDSRETVKAACGDPNFINKEGNPDQPSSQEQLLKTTTFTYNSTPPVTLTFENGKLKTE